jgi:hypothetical protein
VGFPLQSLARAPATIREFATANSRTKLSPQEKEKDAQRFF